MVFPWRTLLGASTLGKGDETSRHGCQRDVDKRAGCRGKDFPDNFISGTPSLGWTRRLGTLAPLGIS